jgi:DNA uptake protein ComE-like DNA-binding protein
MRRTTRTTLAVFAALAVAGPLTDAAQAQVGRTAGMLDPNVATEAELLTVPNITPALAKAILEKRPFLRQADFNAALTGLGKEQLAQTYGKLFVHLNLNAATDEEILMIPNIGNRMLREFKEYRPYKALAVFKREMGKYVKEDEVARLAGYVFVPMDLNTASDEDLLTIPGLGPRMLREFKEYRPYKAIEQFRREIGKYVKPPEVARLERYIVIN